MRQKIVHGLALVAFGIICMNSPSAAAQSSKAADANGVKITGRVSCSRFGRGDVTARKGMSVSQTIQYCANSWGGAYTLVAGNKLYRLTGDQNMLAKLSGQTVTIGGQMVPEPTDVTTVQLMGTVAVSEVVPTKE